MPQSCRSATGSSPRPWSSKVVFTFFIVSELFAFHLDYLFRLFDSWESSDDILEPGLHKLWYPGIRDRSTWGKFGAHGEHGDVFLFSNLGAL